MQIICVDIRGLNEAQARCPGRSKGPASAFAYSLLSHAVREYWGAEALPEIAVDENGKPYFPTHPNWHFSLSHTSTHVLAAISDYPIGADIETERDLTGRRVLDTADEHERENFDFLDVWVLRESLYKLNGSGSLREMHFRMDGDVIVAPTAGVKSRLYSDIPGCHAAACCYDGELPERLIVVPPSAILL